MTRKSRSTPAQERAVREHRDALRAVKRAVAEWATRDEGRRDRIAAAMIERLGECATDKDGDDTLEVVSELFEEQGELLALSHGSGVARALAGLANAGHCLGRVQALRAEH